MGLGSNFKAKVDRVLNNRAIRSTCTFVPRTKTIGAYGGYEVSTKTLGTSVTVNCVPAEYFGTKMLIRSEGNFNAGDVKLIIPGETTITKDYHVTWQSETYDVSDIKPIILNNIKVAIIVILSKDTG